MTRQSANIIIQGSSPDTAPRIGGYLTTYTGIHFYPIDPRAGEFNLIDVAQGLSHENRANGQTILPMCVAQHCVNVAMILRDMGHSIRTQLIGLTHDVSEAYIKDMPSPVKEWLPDYKAIEAKVQAAAYEWAGLGVVTDEEYAPVHKVDKDLFPVEARFFMPKAKHPIVPYLEDMVIEPISPQDARAEFIKLFHELTASLYCIS
jgi:hypothetical protein